MNKTKYKNILLLYGCGGHAEQASRLSTLLSSRFDFVNIFTITDLGTIKKWSNNHLEIGELRDKRMGILPSSMIYYFCSTLILLKFIKKNNIDLVFSLGPGVSVLPSLLARLLVIRVIHIESWSRFYSVSLTGKVMRFIANDFWFQNIELSSFYKYGKFVGRL